MSNSLVARTPFFRQLLLAFLVTLVIVLVFPRVFLENDDLGFIYLLSHGFYAPWVSKPLCWLLLRLYHSFPGVAWYGILHYLILALDLGVLFKLVDDWAADNALSSRTRRWLLAATALLFFPFILRITFTCSSILSGGLGLLAFLASLKAGAQGHMGANPFVKAFPPAVMAALGFGFVFSLSYLVRPEGLGAMVFLLPVLVAGFLSLRKVLASPRGVALGVAFLLPLFVWVGLDKLVLRYPAAQVPYLNFVTTSNDDFGFGYTEPFKIHPDWLSRVGWNRTDYGMLERFLYWDESVFSQAKMDRLAAMAPMAIRERVQSLLKPEVLFQRVWATLAKTWLSNYPFTLYCLGLFILFSLMGTTRLSRAFPGVALGFVFVGSLVMQYVLRFPYRVACPVIIVSSLSMLALPGFEARRIRDGNGRLQRPALGVLGLSALVLFAFNGPVRLVKTFSPALAETRARLAQLSQVQADHYLLREAGVILISASDPLDPMPLKYPDIGPGWLIRSIPYYQRLQAFGISRGSDLLPASLNDPRILYFFKDKNLPFLQSYMQAHYGLQGQFAPVDNILDTPFYKGRHLYRLVSSDVAAQ